MKFNVRLVQYICNNCGGWAMLPHRVYEPGFELLLSEHKNEWRYVLKHEDKPYSDLELLLTNNDLVKGLNEHDLHEICGSIYGMTTCDPDAEGYSYRMIFSMRPTCERCGKKYTGWHSEFKYEFSEMDLTCVSHNTWNCLSETDKAEKVSASLIRLCDDPPYWWNGRLWLKETDPTFLDEYREKILGHR